ncbi:hypothetical protein [Streptomyces sp. NPDC026092]|uniref:hypothetical protein n=1 Tax=Streptomyces sp. NPDC026092 TaxID=3154797 RepID=UPI0034014E9A
MRLDFDEDQPLTAVTHQELFQAFIGAAPTTSQSPARRRPVGWTVTGQGVRLHVRPTGEVLDRAAVVELQAALSAWLHVTKDAGQPVPQGDGPTPRPGRPADGHVRT